VASVALLPPTLIASVYGMNFRFMPELEWKYGYVYVLLLMVASAVGPMMYFRRRGWLK
jgi:magnesium transporter